MNAFMKEKYKAETPEMKQKVEEYCQSKKDDHCETQRMGKVHL